MRSAPESASAPWAPVASAYSSTPTRRSSAWSLCCQTSKRISQVKLIKPNKIYKRQKPKIAGGGGAGGVITALFYNKGYTETLENLTAFDNSKRCKFNLSGQYSNIRLDLNSKVAIDYVSVTKK